VDRKIACGDFRIVDNHIVGWVTSSQDFLQLFEAFKEITSVEFVARTGPRKENIQFKKCKVSPSIADDLTANRFYVVVKPAATWECKAGKQRENKKKSKEQQHLQLQSSQQQQDEQQERQVLRRDDGKDKAGDVAVRLAPISQPKKPRLTFQGTYKQDCPAKISVITLLFLDGRVSSDMTADQIKFAKKSSLAALTNTGRTTTMVERTYFAFPLSAHHNNHLSEFSMRGNRLHPQVSEKLAFLVRDGVVTTHDVTVALNLYVSQAFPLASKQDTRYENTFLDHSFFHGSRYDMTI
jgi:hypothetical protein